MWNSLYEYFFSCVFFSRPIRLFTRPCIDKVQVAVHICSNTITLIINPNYIYCSDIDNCNDNQLHNRDEKSNRREKSK